MADCAYCGRRIDRIPWRCRCGAVFCADHRLPENHRCPLLPCLENPARKLQERRRRRPEDRTGRKGAVAAESIVGRIVLIGILIATAYLLYGLLVAGAGNGGAGLPHPTPPTPAPTDATPGAPGTSIPSSRETQGGGGADSGRPPIGIRQLELRIHQLINEERVARGLPELAWDSSLAAIAREHSEDMAARGYFSHTTPEGEGPQERAAAAGYVCRKQIENWIYGLGENIFQNNLYDSVTYLNGIPVSREWNDLEDLATSTVQGWMNSSGHRENILRTSFDREGIGVAIAKDDRVYITEELC